MIFKVLCDVHIAFKVVRFFKDKGYEAIHVNDILDSYHTKDSDISKYADQNGFLVVSKDADFQNSHLLKNTPERLLKISLGNLSTKKLLVVLEQHLPTLVQHFSKGKCLIEIGDGFIQIIE